MLTSVFNSTGKTTEAEADTSSTKSQPDGSGDGKTSRGAAADPLPVEDIKAILADTYDPETPSVRCSCGI